MGGLFHKLAALFGLFLVMASDTISFKKILFIDAPISTVFSFWSNFRNFTDFIWLIESVEVLDNKRSRWIVRAPLNKKVEFDSEITENVHNSSIVWESRHVAANSRGDIKFTEHGDRTRVDLIFSYSIKHPRVHRLAKLVSRFGFPSVTFDDGLRKIKHEIEGRFVQRTCKGTVSQ